MNFILELVDELPLRRGAFRWSAGAVACVLFYFSLASAAMSHHDGPSVIVVLGIEIALAAAILTGVFRHFAVGFIATIVAFAIATKGQMLVLPWGMPVIAAYEVVAGRATHHGPPTLGQRAWLKARRDEPPALVDGQILTNTVNECAAKYRGNALLDSYPPNETEEMFVNCNRLAASRAGATLSRYSESDNGWRWTYVPAAPDSLGRITQYSVRVFEDSVIGRASPQYASDASGAIQELNPGKPPATVATPLASLRLLHQCLEQVPELRKGDSEVVRKYSYYRNPINEVLARCPALRGHVSLGDDQLSKYGRTAVTAPGRNRNIADTVAVFGIELIPIDEKQFVFAVSATSNSALPSYFMEQSGAVHVRSGEKATDRDPLVAN